jgi:hypothetical protein
MVGCGRKLLFWLTVVSEGLWGLTFALIVAKDESLDEKLKDIILF